MKKEQLITKVKERREAIGMNLGNLSKLSKMSDRTLLRFFTGDDVKLSTVEKITQVLGLDFAGNEEIDIQTLKEKRAEKRALYIVGLVQDTSSLEGQGLDEKHIEEMLKKTKEEFLTGEHQDKLWSS